MSDQVLNPYGSSAVLEALSVSRDRPAVRHGGLDEWACTQYGRLLRTIARDATEDAFRRSALVVAPHPDDETLGCGGVIARKREAGRPVWVVVASDGVLSHRSAVLSGTDLSEIRRRELFDACAILDVAPEAVFWLGFPDRGLQSHAAALESKLTALIADLRPEEIYVPTPIDAHPDHRATYRAAVRARRAAGSGCRVCEYPVWFWSRSSWIDGESERPAKLWQLVSRPLAGLATLRPRLVQLGHFRSRKLTAIAAYRSQTTNLTGEPDWAVFEPHVLARFMAPEEIFFHRDPRDAETRRR